MENIKVQRKKSKNNVLTVYDIFDKDVGKSLEKLHSNRHNKKEYNKIKIPSYSNQKHKFWVGVMKSFIEAQDLWGDDNRNRMTIEYLTPNGWVGNLQDFGKQDIKKLFAIPKTDRGLPSGEHNNKLDPDEQIYLVRINVFKF